MAKSYIIIVGEYTPQFLENKAILSEKTKEQAEINIFDFPRVGGKDIVERMDEYTFVHRYANPSNKLADAVNRAKEYVRDIIALGTYKHYVFVPSNNDLKELYKRIVRALEIYGVEYQIM